MILVALLGLLVLASAAGRIADWDAARAPGADTDVDPAPSPASRAWQAVQARRARVPALPDGHRPPAGLGPISPSERFLCGESARGLREIELFLLEQRTP